MSLGCAQATEPVDLKIFTIVWIDRFGATMDTYDPMKPFRLISVPSPGVSEGRRAGSIHYASYATLVEAEQAARNLEPGYLLSQLLYGPQGTHCLTSADRTIAILSDLF
jgi:hypothetical protein